MCWPSILPEKRQFVAQIDRNTVFLDLEAHIPYWLYIMVMHINYCGLKKNQISVQNSNVLAFGFTEKGSL
jgi:hypothetical protein